jgi:hypothetical protein
MPCLNNTLAREMRLLAIRLRRIPTTLWGQNTPPNRSCLARRGLLDDQNGWFSRLQWLTAPCHADCQRAWTKCTESEASASTCLAAGIRLGPPDRRKFREVLSRVGCIDLTQEEVVLRRSGEIHRPQFRPVNCVVQMTALRWILMSAFVTQDEPS